MKGKKESYLNNFDQHDIGSVNPNGKSASNLLLNQTAGRAK